MDTHIHFYAIFNLRLLMFVMPDHCYESHKVQARQELDNNEVRRGRISDEGVWGDKNGADEVNDRTDEDKGEEYEGAANARIKRTAMRMGMMWMGTTRTGQMRMRAGTTRTPWTST